MDHLGFTPRVKEPVKLTKTSVNYALNEISSMFPQFAANVNLYRQELVNCLLTNTRPAADSKLGRLTFAMAANPDIKVPEPPFITLTECQKNCGVATLKIGLFVLDLVGIKAANIRNAEAAERVAVGIYDRAQAWFYVELEELVNGKGIDRILALFSFIRTMKECSIWEILYETWKQEASWYDWVLFVVTVTAQLLFWFASDGIAFIALVAASMISFVEMAISVSNVLHSCFEKLKKKEDPLFSFTPTGQYLSTAKDVKIIFSAIPKKELYGPIEIEITNEQSDCYITYDKNNNLVKEKKKQKKGPDTFLPFGNYSDVFSNAHVRLECQLPDKEGAMKPVKKKISSTDVKNQLWNINGEVYVFSKKVIPFIPRGSYAEQCEEIGVTFKMQRTGLELDITDLPSCTTIERPNGKWAFTYSDEYATTFKPLGLPQRSAPICEVILHVRKKGGGHISLDIKDYSITTTFSIVKGLLVADKRKIITK